MPRQMKNKQPDAAVLKCKPGSSNTGSIGAQNSAVLTYSDRTWPGKLPFDAFIQSAGIGKELASYESPTTASTI